MGKYILRRLIIALPSLLGISLILFVLLANEKPQSPCSIAISQCA